MEEFLHSLGRRFIGSNFRFLHISHKRDRVTQEVALWICQNKSHFLTDFNAAEVAQAAQSVGERVWRVELDPERGTTLTFALPEQSGWLAWHHDRGSGGHDAGNDDPGGSQSGRSSAAEYALPQMGEIYLPRGGEPFSIPNCRI
jgi:hypothetical protein